MSQAPPPRSAREAAHLLLQMCVIGVQLRSRGFCLGELHAEDLDLHEHRIRRARNGLIRSSYHRMLRARHRRRGHDLSCVTVGIPLSTVRRLLREWAGESAAEYLYEAFEHAIRQLASGQTSQLGEIALITYEIGRWLTIEPPTDFASEAGLGVGS